MRLDETLLVHSPPCYKSKWQNHTKGSDFITPPLSPTFEPHESFMLDRPILKEDMVNPNVILAQPIREPEIDESSLSSLHLEQFPLLDGADIKMEPYFDDGFNIGDSFCHHGYDQSFCKLCFDDSFKSEIINDCMLTSCSDLIDDKEALRGALGLPFSFHPISPSPLALPTASPTLSTSIKRVHLDSTSSRYSEVIDPIISSIAGMENVLSSPPGPPPMERILETPSETSDTDTDLEECASSAEHVHLDHNYHRGDIERPPMKDFASTPLTDSEDEIDVVGGGAHESFLLNHRYSKYQCSVEVRDARGNPDLGATVTVGPTPAKRGRKPGARKVGRPCKNLKRINDKSSPLSNGSSRRYGARSIAMDPQKRNLHNSMERKRRVDLKNCFDTVRCRIPALRDRTRAPKVAILRSAAELVKNLEKGDVKKRLEIERLVQHQKLLIHKLQRLKQELGIEGVDMELG